MTPLLVLVASAGLQVQHTLEMLPGHQHSMLSILFEHNKSKEKVRVRYLEAE